MNEAETRAELIDPKLEQSGWKTDSEKGVRVRREYLIKPGEIRSSGQRTGRLTADYILEYRNIKLAVLEAKSNELEVNEGVAQAKIYAQKLQLNVCFASNGNEIYEIDTITKTEGKIKKFPSPEELWNKIFNVKNDWLDEFNKIPLKFTGRNNEARYYQELAVNKTLEAISKDKKRILLTLATGTGKTFISFQIAWKLFNSRWTLQKDKARKPRILFLTDRNILANQAYLDFGAFGSDPLIRIKPKEISKRGEVPRNGNVFFTIFQTFMSGETENYFGYEKDFFDLVIIDECHRGGAKDESSWRDILKYFSEAVHLGLTATPKREDNVDTYEYFNKPVYVYSLNDGIRDGFLTPFKIQRIQSTLDEYSYTPDDDILEGEVIEGHIYKEHQFNVDIEIEERERKRVKDFLNLINSNEKTLVFCANQAHAALIRDLINQEKGDPNLDYCVRVTANDGDLGEMYLERFKENDKKIPTILTTSRKLSTGVDARNIRNIILLRPVKNMIEFKQIIGRGTRLFEGKNYFTIVDFVDAYQNFHDEKWDGPPSDPEPPKPPKPPAPPKPPQPPKPKIEKVKIKLSDNKIREIQTIKSLHFYVDGKTITANEFLNYLFDKIDIPALLGNEEELRKIWSNPITREALLTELEEKGCHREDLNKIKEIIDAKDSDIYDVLEFIAFAKKPVSRISRVEKNKSKIFEKLNINEKDFILFVLGNYISVGEKELEIKRLSSIITAKYGTISSAQKELGPIDEIQKTFIQFQKELYNSIST